MVSSVKPHFQHKFCMLYLYANLVKLNVLLLMDSILTKSSRIYSCLELSRTNLFCQHSSAPVFDRKDFHRSCSLDAWVFQRRTVSVGRQCIRRPDQKVISDTHNQEQKIPSLTHTASDENRLLISHQIFFIHLSQHFHCLFILQSPVH